MLINQVEDGVMGAGELSITLSPAAIGYAIFSATGERPRQIIPSELVLEALTPGQLSVA